MSVEIRLAVLLLDDAGDNADDPLEGNSHGHVPAVGTVIYGSLEYVCSLVILAGDPVEGAERGAGGRGEGMGDVGVA